ncbi:MAG: tetraacyldisaccharide 4'-kinase [Pseudomonadota bacterium]
MIRFATPSFWYEPPGLRARLLAPLGAIYGHVTVSRLRKAPAIPSHPPVICIGNLTAGGGGKTPSTIALHRLLGRQDAHFLTRGHGGKLPGPVMVDPEHHTASNVGDEPLLLAQQAPCWVARDRAAGLQAAKAAGAGLVIMDDGLQNPTVNPAIRLLAVKGEMGFGNGGMIPAGPLREPLDHGLKRVDAMLCIGPMTHHSLRDLTFDKPIFAARYVPDHDALAAIKGKSCVAFAGIARPDSFFSMLREHGVELADTIAFPDHHHLTTNEWRALTQRIVTKHTSADTVLVTTEKDWVRLPPDQRAQAHPVPITLEWENPSAMIGFITDHKGYKARDHADV